MSYRNDFRILLGMPAQQYDLSDFILELNPCNKCLPDIPADGHHSLKSYVLNGKRVESHRILIEK